MTCSKIFHMHPKSFIFEGFGDFVRELRPYCSDVTVSAHLCGLKNQLFTKLKPSFDPIDASLVLQILKYLQNDGLRSKKV